MDYKHNKKKKGDIIRAEEWNAFGNELEWVEQEMVKASDETVDGNLNITGNMGIGTKEPMSRLDVNGNLSAEIIYARTVRAARFQGDGSYLSGIAGKEDLSDKRLKTVLKPLKEVQSRINEIQAVYYKWNDHEKVKDLSKESQIGLIADEVEAVFPELISKDNDGFKQMEYGKLTAVLLEVVKEQGQNIAELKERIVKLEQSQ